MTFWSFVSINLRFNPNVRENSVTSSISLTRTDPMASTIVEEWSLEEKKSKLKGISEVKKKYCNIWSIKLAKRGISRHVLCNFLPSIKFHRIVDQLLPDGDSIYQRLGYFSAIFLYSVVFFPTFLDIFHNYFVLFFTPSIIVEGRPSVDIIM